tara:strand:- start:3355 stop:5004 length:1650 start_codon:yes stop_codon:yes gene_type:complete
MFNKLLTTIIIFSLSFSMNENLTEQQKEEVRNKVVEEFAKKIFASAMEAKRAMMTNQTREQSLLDNFATTAPRDQFIFNADIDSSLAYGVESATVFASTDNQSSWISAPAAALNTVGYENTWEGQVFTGGGNSVYSYLAGEVDSEVLGEEFGTILVTSSPHNVNGSWPVSNNLYARLATDASGDAPASQDILEISGTYKGDIAIDADGEEYTDVERVYFSMDLAGNCCPASDGDGGFFDFGPWYLYGIGIVNPEIDDPATAGTAYAIGYGDGGFWGGDALYPGVLKISGDLATGTIDNFEFLSNNISYNTNGNTLQVTTLLEFITNDAGWGAWPNSYNGMIVNSVTVQAALDGLDVDATILDQSDPGLFICSTQFQEGNSPLILSSPNFDGSSNILTVNYSDADGNLPWFKAAQICNTEQNGGACFSQVDMIPDSHDYEEGVQFSTSITDVMIDEYALSGEYVAKFWFADDDIDNYPSAQIEMPISISGSNCTLVGDSNGDGALNVLDVVLLVNLVLDVAQGDSCSDVNGDGALNVLDVVLLVNLVLGS